MSQNYTAVFAIAIQNGSGVTLAIGSFYLTAGEWAPGRKPDLQRPLDSGNWVQYENVAPAYFTALGGRIVLSPVNGGAIYINWSWPGGLPPSGSATPDSTSGLDLTYNLISGSTNVTLQVSVTNT